MGKNKSKDISWVDRIFKRYKDIGTLIPHRQRKLYEAIQKYWVSGRTVVDIGSSCGVGSNILADGARHVWGVDINEEAVRYATRAYKRSNLDFAVLDIENPPTRSLSTFEIVTAIEILEHLENVNTGLDTIKRFFNPKLNTVGFITCPNFANEKVKENEKKHGLHLNHWTAGDFYKLMIENFEVVTLFSVDKIKQWNNEETVDGDTKDYLIVAKVEKAK